MKIEVLDHGYVELVEAWGMGKAWVGEFDWDPEAMDGPIEIKSRPDYEVGIIEAARMRASASLRNWLAFLTLRRDSAAQWEIRQYAAAVGWCVAERFPQTWALFNQENVA